MPTFSFIGYTLAELFEKPDNQDSKFINKQVQLVIHQMMCLKRVEKKKLLCHNK